MSNPLSNLRKGRKTSFTYGGGSHNGSVPFRTSNHHTNDETSLLDEVTGNMATSRMSRSTPLPKLVPPYHHSTTTGSPRQSVTPSAGTKIAPEKKGEKDGPFCTFKCEKENRTTSTTPTDHDLMSLMMTRLSSLENRVAEQASEIATKDKKINILEDKLRIFKNARDEGRPGRCQELEKKCLHLQKQLHDMEAFLEDYGMVWVGEKESDGEGTDLESLSDEGSSSGGTWRPGASVAGGEFHVDYNLIIKNIQELNVLGGEGVSKIQHTTDGARLKMPDPVQLTLYANGIVMFSGPFRPFTDPSTQACIQDLTDGFFPSELQHRYPDGIPFALTDKRDVYFKDRLSEGFTGVGQVLGGDTKPSRLIPSKLSKSKNEQTDLKEESTLPGPKLSVDQFLSKLPPAVIKNGKIIDVRTSLADTIKGSAAGSEDKVTLVETAAVQEMKDRMAIEESSRPPSSRQVSTLRIKSDNGQTFIVKMKFTETIGNLREYLDQQMSPGVEYQIMSTFPSRAYTENHATLQQCGLVPNAALHLRILKK